MAEAMYDSSHCVGRRSLCFLPQWNRFVSLETIVCGHFTYLAIVFALRQMMKTREKPFNPQFAMRMYNVVQIVLSTTMAIGLSPFLTNNVFNLNGKFCATIEFWIFVHYLTKYIDMFDTFFMVLRKKDEQLTFLHLYHHTTIGFIWGLLLHNGIANGTAFFGAWINSFVHALMYSHYLWTSIGYTNPLKAYLTQFQMLQFFLCIIQAVLVIFVDKQISTPWALLQFSYHMTLLYLFMQFHKRDTNKRSRYQKPPHRKTV